MYATNLNHLAALNISIAIAILRYLQAGAVADTREKRVLAFGRVSGL